LTSLVYFSTGTTQYVSPSQQTDVGTIIETDFGIDSKRRDFRGALLYKLQRGDTTKTGNYPNNSTAFIENTATYIYLLVVWDVRHYDDGFYAFLIECASDFTWDEDKLWALHKEYGDQFCEDYDYSPITWLIHGGVVTKIRRDVTYGSNYKLEIVISEGIEDCDPEKPIQIDPERLVLSL
jgi:hypothetical protein